MDWMSLARDRIDPQHFNRAAGVVLSALKIGPAKPSSRLYGALRRIGVLERDPSEWEDSPVLSHLPWGARRVEAPAPEVPPGVEGPWPQPARVGEAFYPAILNTADSDRIEHFRYNAARYLGQVVQLTPRAALRALRGPRLLSITDDDLSACSRRRPSPRRGKSA